MAKELVKQDLPALSETMAQAVELFDVPGLVTGFEQMTQADLSLPKLTILQAGMSPQLKQKSGDYIVDAKPGQFCDTALGRTWDSLAVIPVYYARIFLEWGPERGDGLQANHGINSAITKGLPLENPKIPGVWVTPDGNLIVETPTFYVLNMTEPVVGRRGFIPMQSTQVKRAKRWNDQLDTDRIPRADGTSFKAPIYWRVWFAEPIDESNKKGDWFGWKFVAGPNILEVDPTRKTLELAQKFATEAKEGLVQIDVSRMENENGSGAF